MLFNKIKTRFPSNLLFAGEGFLAIYSSPVRGLQLCKTSSIFIIYRTNA